MPQLRCPYCGDDFEPEPHLAETQICCGKKRCKTRRKAESQARWVKKNPEYFKGEYRRTLLWLAEHPGYLRAYRSKNPDYVQKDNAGRRRRRIRAGRRADIQDPHSAHLGHDIKRIISVGA